MPSFADIANKKLDETVKAPLPPVGHYKFIVSKLPENRDINKNLEAVEFQCQAIAARDDVDPDSLATYGSLDKLRLRKSFLFDKTDAVAFQQTENNLKRFFIEHLKCAKEGEGFSYKKAMNESVNCPFIGKVDWKAGKEGSDQEGEFFANIGKTAPVE